MCGIAGLIALDGEPPDSARIGAMCDAMQHRGPDDAGYLVEGRVALGMRRLSIIDVAGGHQPIYNEDGSVAVFFNGEIYNFRELRRQLEAQGHTFATNSDTEVIVHLWEQVGIDFPTALERHVCDRALRSEATQGRAGSRSRGYQAALLRARRR